MLSIGYSQNCCGVGEICELRSHKSAKEAMQEFCRQTYMQKVWDYQTNKYQYKPYKYGKAKALYMFAGVVKHTTGTAEPTYGFNYGPAFAKFIEDNDLGAVVESASAPNRTAHPTHVVRAWIWQPAPRKLRAWYNKNVLKEEVAGGKTSKDR